MMIKGFVAAATLTAMTLATMPSASASGDLLCNRSACTLDGNRFMDCHGGCLIDTTSEFGWTITNSDGYSMFIDTSGDIWDQSQGGD